MLDEQGDGEITDENIAHLCHKFAQQRLKLAEEHAARGAKSRHKPPSRCI